MSSTTVNSQNGTITHRGQGWSVRHQVGDVQHTLLWTDDEAGVLLRVSEASALVRALMQAADMPNFHDAGYAKGRASRDAEVEELRDAMAIAYGMVHDLLRERGK